MKGVKISLLKNVSTNENFSSANFRAFDLGWSPALPRFGSPYFCGMYWLFQCKYIYNEKI